VLLWTFAEIASASAGRVLRAGVLLLAGGIVLELLGGAIVEAGPDKSFLYNLEVALEEGCELSGWILVAAALLATALSWASAGSLETPTARGVIPANERAEKEGFEPSRQGIPHLTP
jgi:hypothetical protein